MSAWQASREAGVDVLFLRLEGPLMAWGDNARWTVRQTRREPTKSGVIGLLAACLGWGADPESDAKIAELAQRIQLGVRVDRAGTVLRDYHTVVGGVVSAEGRVKVNSNTKEPETVVSERYYLADACFLVALVGPPDVLDTLELGLTDPVWPPFLGRKSCVPALPVYPVLPGHPSRGNFSSLEEALASFPYLCHDAPPSALRVVCELPNGTPSPDLPLQRRRDVPLSLAARLFGYRYVYERHLSPPLAAVPGGGDGAKEG